MLFFIHHEDKENSDELRKANRSAHLESLINFKVLVGGPTLTDDGARMNGTVLIIDLPDRQAVDEFIKQDPYVKAALFKTTIVRRWHKVKFEDLA